MRRAARILRHIGIRRRYGVTIARRLPAEVVHSAGVVSTGYLTLRKGRQGNPLFRTIPKEVLSVRIALINETHGEPKGEL